jgi:phenylpropionate dioxygenase-like ring-hydroxylating dioxygenase large terminal subunit
MNGTLAFPPPFSPLAFADRASDRSARPAASLAEIQQGICAAADLPLAQARTLPAAAYTSEAFFDWETAQLLRADWQCVAHVSQLAQAGDFLNLDLLGEPLIVVRGKDAAVRVLSRVCPHRAMDLMPAGFGYDGHGPAVARGEGPGGGHTRLFLCPYHAWTFELDGRLKACPEMQQAEGFARDDVGLKVFRSEVWQGFVFVNLDGQAPPFGPGLEPMARDLAAFRLAELQLVIAREWDCPFNWKALVENFM